MKSIISSFAIGVLFALGLGMAGMTQPQKVLSFLDIFGHWDPSLGFVMAGALVVHFIFFRLITKQSSPLFAEHFRIPQIRDINSRLFIGSAMFGIGWGLAGYCPAPAVTSLASFTEKPLIFVASMLIGMIAFRFSEKTLSPWFGAGRTK